MWLVPLGSLVLKNDGAGDDVAPKTAPKTVVVMISECLTSV